MGTVKRTHVSEFANIRNSGLIALTLRDGDELSNVLTTDGNQNILIGTHLGYAVTFNESDVRAMGRTAAGVRGINLRPEDYVVGSGVLGANDQVLVISSEYPVKGRGGKGIKTANITEKNGPLAGVIVLDSDEDIMVITTDGIMIRFKTADVSQTSRSTIGVRLIKVNDDSRVASLTIVPTEAEQDEIGDEDSEK